MAKMAYALISILIIEFALWLFSGQTSGNTSLFNLIFNLSEITTSSFYELIRLALITFAGSAFIIGNLYSINIYALYAGIGAVCLTFVSVIANFAVFINGSLNAVNPLFSKILIVFLCGPLTIFYLMAVTEWVRSNR